MFATTAAAETALASKLHPRGTNLTNYLDLSEQDIYFCHDRWGTGGASLLLPSRCLAPNTSRHHGLAWLRHPSQPCVKRECVTGLRSVTVAPGLSWPPPRPGSHRSRGSCGGYWDLVNAVANLLDYGVVSEQCLPYSEPPRGAPPACARREGCQVLPPGVWDAVVLNTTHQVPGAGRALRLGALLPVSLCARRRPCQPARPAPPLPQVKQHITRWGAVLTGIYIREELWRFWGSGQPSVYRAAAPKGSRHMGGHGIMVYGYDDNGRFWRAKNRCGCCGRAGARSARRWRAWGQLRWLAARARARVSGSSPTSPRAAPVQLGPDRRHLLQRQHEGLL